MGAPVPPSPGFGLKVPFCDTGGDGRRSTVRAVAEYMAAPRDGSSARTRAFMATLLDPYAMAFLNFWICAAETCIGVVNTTHLIGSVQPVALPAASFPVGVVSEPE